MELIVDKIPGHNCKCIIVPSERLNKPVSDYTEIIVGEKKYKILQWVTILKTDRIPSSLLLLSIGILLEKEAIFKKYKKSNKLYFFICELDESKEK